jgi:hypothetical protein
VIEGAMTGEMFLAYVEQCLVPTLRRIDIVVMDRAVLQRAGACRSASRVHLRFGDPEVFALEAAVDKAFSFSFWPRHVHIYAVQSRRDARPRLAVPQKSNAAQPKDEVRTLRPSRRGFDLNAAWRRVTRWWRGRNS